MGMNEISILTRLQECTGIFSGEEIGLISRYVRAQIPKEPRLVDGYDGRAIRCPNCDRRVYANRRFKPSVNRYCKKCGQKLDWNRNIIERMTEVGMIEPGATEELRYEQG